MLHRESCKRCFAVQATYRHSYNTGQLPDHMRKSRIRLLYKKDSEEDKRYPKNYRPVALLNVDYKILSKLLANKLKLHLPQIISEDQYCMPKKYIGNLIHLIQSVINDKDNIDKEAFVALLDFKKAFDSVNHEFTFAAMKAFGIPDEFIRFTKLAFVNTSACCIVNGQRTKFFPLPGGGRQGDNLYPLIFCIVMQVMNIAISMQGLQGIDIDDDRNNKLVGPISKTRRATAVKVGPVRKSRRAAAVATEKNRCAAAAKQNANPAGGKSLANSKKRKKISPKKNTATANKKRVVAK